MLASPNASQGAPASHERRSMKLSRFTTLIVLFSVLLFGSPALVAAVSPTPNPQMKEATTGAQAAELQGGAASDYVLPYPGILPDHPLYNLKRLRDYILDRLIVDPVRKAEFHILQADKRLNMGIFLTTKGNATLAEESISKGEKYMHRAVFGLLEVKSSGKLPPAHIVERLEKSLEKHLEVLSEMVENAGEPQKSALAGSLELVASLRQEIPKLSN